jgi:hypothetical protein
MQPNLLQQRLQAAKHRCCALVHGRQHAMRNACVVFDWREEKEIACDAEYDIRPADEQGPGQVHAALAQAPGHNVLNNKQGCLQHTRGRQQDKVRHYYYYYY